MVIRRAQFEAFKVVAAAKFEDDALDLVSRHWPEIYSSTPAGELTLLVREMLGRASGYQITSRTDLLRFLNVAFALGPHFDSDQRYPWAKAILTDPGVAASARMDQLCEWTRRTLASQRENSDD